MILLDVKVLKKGSEVKEKLGAPNQLKADGAGTDGFGGYSGFGSAWSPGCRYMLD